MRQILLSPHTSFQFCDISRGETGSLTDRRYLARLERDPRDLQLRTVIAVHLPRLTLMAQPCDEIGRKAADLLIARIGSKHRPRETVRLSPVLRVRESCGEAA